MNDLEDLSRRAANLYRANRHQEALMLCLSLAESSQAPPWILSLIGTMHFWGRGTEVNREAAVRWYRRAADAGDPGALVFLSGLEQEAGRYDAARAMLEDALSRGYTRALIQLGYIHDHGLGVTRDSRRARQYYEQAAKQGYVFAKRMIAGQLLRGDEGLSGRLRGLLMFLRCTFELVGMRIRDPYSDKGKR